MDNTKPYAGASDQRLTALINKDNNSALVLGVDFTFGRPQPFSDFQGRNTKVALAPLKGKPPFTDPEFLHYTRLALTHLDNLPAGWVQPVAVPSVPFKLRDILANINYALGLNLSADEIVDTTYDAVLAKYRLPIDEGVSLAWIDSDFSFDAIIGGEIPLASIVTIQMLSGLQFARPS